MPRCEAPRSEERNGVLMPLEHRSDEGNEADGRLATVPFISLVLIYRAVSPFFFFFVLIMGIRCSCKYPISCSRYALLELKENKNIFNALCRIVVRLFSCHPLNPKLGN